MAPSAKRVLLIGLDCAAPRFVFGPGAFELPNLRRLMGEGAYGELISCHPPITVPAWTSMLTGLDPGVLGIYGLTHRGDRSYGGGRVVTSEAVRHERVWDILSRHGKRCVVIGVPQTYPVRPLNGWLAADFLAPDASAPFTYPPELKAELLGALGDYQFDVAEYRTGDKAGLLGRIHAFMKNRFDTAEYLMKAKPWDFFVVVEMGLDRLHHGFWSYCDPQHPKYTPGNPFECAFRDYYRAVDDRVGRLVELAGAEAAVLVVSDHGAKALHGAVCINQWLLDEGYIRLRFPLDGATRLEDAPVDWGGTTAWSTGGYCARVYLNVEGRDPQGAVPPDRYEHVRSELARRIEAMRGPDGAPLGNRVYRPEEVYAQVNGVAPDLLVYLGDLHYRAIGTLGHRNCFAAENDTGPDGANHDFAGMYVFGGAGIERQAGVQRRGILDIAPLVLRLFGVAGSRAEGRGAQNVQVSFP